jgi:4a-hydroxytetrahydrobiopterin dehydratase
VFEFKSFADALAFTVQIGRLAEEVDRHPAILTEWSKATLAWWTHGLHLNGFITAAKAETLNQ